MRSQKKRKSFSPLVFYRTLFQYISEQKFYFLGITLVFFSIALFSFFVPPTPEIQQELLKVIQNLLAETEGMNALELTIFIFWNNLQASFMGLFFGIFLGIFPVLAAIVNGYLVGFVAAKSVSVEGLFVLWRLLPHGVFELPAVFIALGLGVRLGLSPFSSKPWPSFKYHLQRSTQVFFAIVMPLLIIAAIIEGLLIATVG